MTLVLLLGLLTLVASGIGTATGFGTSTVMIPVIALFVPLPVVLLFVGVIHLCGSQLPSPGVLRPQALHANVPIDVTKLRAVSSLVHPRMSG